MSNSTLNRAGNKGNKVKATEKLIIGKGTVRIHEKESVSVGIDVHKKSYDVAFYSFNRKEIVGTYRNSADISSLIASLSRFKKNICGIVYEAGFCGFNLARALRGAGYPADVISPAHTPQTAADESKTDPFDARKLATYAANGLLRIVAIPSERQEYDRAAYRHYDSMRKKAAGIKTEIRSFLDFHGLKEPAGLSNWSDKSIQALKDMKMDEELRHVMDSNLRLLEVFEREKSEARARLDKIGCRKEYIRDYIHFKDMKGIGVVTAMAVILELFSPHRFEKSGQVAKMMCLAPGVSESGGHRKQRGLLESGNRRLRHILVEAAWRWIAQDDGAKKHYQKLRRNSGCAQKAIIGVARKLGIIMWRMMCDGSAYRPLSA